MTTVEQDVRACPYSGQKSDSKSIVFAERTARETAGARVETRFAALREIFRMPRAEQGMQGVEAFDTKGNPDHTPVFFLDGEPHRQRRNAIARFFTPKTVTTRYHDVIHRTSDKLMAELRRDGSGVLDIITFQMAVEVTAEVVGLTESDSKGQAKRLRIMLDSEAQEGGKVARAFKRLLFAYRMQRFYAKDVAPAIAARRRSPRDDVISHMIRENYPKKAMLVECLIYSTAGMVTTRELITMAAWHMLGNEELRLRYVNGTEEQQLGIVEEILRLEPVAGMLYRWIPAEDGQGRQRVFLDVRSANLDEAVAGPCPLALDPDRTKNMRMTTSYMSFGDGPHRCPGAQLALHETRIFLDKLMRLPGIRFKKEPEMRWYATLKSYELRNGIVTCDRDENA